MDIEIVYEDNHLLAVNKPAGWLVQGDQTGDRTLTDWARDYIKAKYGKPGDVFLHPAHRLDRPVSGLVLFARTSKALSRLTVMFRDKQVHKTYLAVALHAPPQKSGELRHFLWKDESKNIVNAIEKSDRRYGDAKEAVLKYTYEGEGSVGHWVRVNPITGRPHQIRVQLAAMGCPIIGDVKYGASTPLPDASIALHGWQIHFNHPVKNEPMTLEAALPEQAWWAR